MVIKKIMYKRVIIEGKILRITIKKGHNLHREFLETFRDLRFAVALFEVSSNNRKGNRMAADIFPDISLILNLISICPARAYFRKIKCPGIVHFVKSALFEKKKIHFLESNLIQLFHFR